MALDDLRRRILDRVPLDALVEEQVRLVARAGHKIGCCPFHEEKSPSFYLYDGPDAHYHCFGCGAHGNAIDWIKHHLGLGYMETLRHLATKFSIESPELDEGRSERGRLKGLHEMMRDAQRFFQEELACANGAPARAYLEGRGFPPDVLTRFGFGLAPDSGFALIDILRRKGFAEEQMLACSLARRSEKSGRNYDFFRNRVTVPIHDREGRVIAFGGRSLGNEQPKYINPTTTDLFDKSHTLFGLHLARDAARTKGRALIAEGYMDVLQLWNHGFTEAVACMGTALTEGQLKLLAPFTRKLYLVFDSDSAGRGANLKAVKHVLSVPQMTVKVVLLPDAAKDDPDSFLRKHGAEAFEQMIAGAVDLFEYAITARLGTAGGFEVAELIREEFAPWLATVTDPIQCALLINRVSQLTGVAERLVAQSVTEHRAGPAVKSTAAAPKGATSRVDALTQRHIRDLTTLEYDILGHFFHAEPGEIDSVKMREFIREHVEWDEAWGELADELLQLGEHQTAPHTTALAEFGAATEPKVMAFLADIKAKASAFNGVARAPMIERLLRQHRARRLRARTSVLKGQLARAGDDAIRILGEISKITKEINALEK